MIAPTSKEKDMCVKAMHANTTFSDQTGKFPITSQRGNKCMMVMVDTDGNAIDVREMKNKTEKEWIKITHP